MITAAFPSVAKLCPNPEALGIAALDLQGWNSTDPVFEHLIAKHKPATIIEVGTWKGASALHMAMLQSKAVPLGVERAIYCVDTWLGGGDHYVNQHEPINDLARDAFGYPRLYHQFLYNTATTLHAPFLHPIVQPSLSGARILGRAGVTAGLIYIDASHVYEDVYADLQHFYGLLTPDGVMFGDDWKDFAGVRLAVTRFAYEQGLELAQTGNGWILRRSQEAA